MKSVTNAQKIIDWLTEHPNSLMSEINEGTNYLAASYVSYLTKNGTLVRTGNKGTSRYRVAQESDHPPPQPNEIPADKRALIECPNCACIFAIMTVPKRAAGKD